MRFVAKLAVAALLAGVATGASAVTVYSEDFSAPAFVGGLLSNDDTSDRFGPTTYFFISDANGWSFDSSNTFLALPIEGSDGALLLNENGRGGSALRLISGLTIGQTYSLSFLLSGDNRPGDAYRLTGGIAGLSFSVDGTDGAPGSNAGTALSYLFTATGTSHQLSFGQVGLSEASPIIDNITITSVGGAVPEAST